MRESTAQGVFPAETGFPAMATGDAGSGRITPRRSRVWELAPGFHCSIVGTCLTTSDVRRLLRKLKDPQADAGDEHMLHSKAVRLAGCADTGGRLLTKALDRRHERHIRKFARARAADEVRALWSDAFADGDIPGAYWATLSHPATDAALSRDVFGEVHMLSHLVGRSTRLDLKRLRHLEEALQAREDRISELEARVAAVTRERTALAERLSDVEFATRVDRIRAGRDAAEPGLIHADLARKLDKAQERIAGLEAERARMQCELAELSARAAAEEASTAAMVSELGAIEATLAGDAEVATPDRGLPGRTLLYVGGRPQLVDQLRSRTRAHGARLLTHDGGLEENLGLLPGLVAQADIVLFPVDCISHAAMTLARRACGELGKDFVPLRTASIACFLAGLAGLPPHKAPAHEG